MATYNGISYRKWGKIRWDKLLRIPPNKVFHGKIFSLWCLTFKTLKQCHHMKLYNINEYTQKTFMVATLKNCEKCESLAQRIFPCLRYMAC